MKLSPIDPVNAYLGSAFAHVGPEQKAQIAALWGLDRPFLLHFLRWGNNLLDGNLGFSTAYNTSVSEVISSRLGKSPLLTALARILSGFLGFLLVLVAAAFGGRWINRILRLYS